MNSNRSLLTSAVAMALTILIGACAPVTSYTDAEAPKRLKLDSATTQVDLRFAPGSAQLAAVDEACLRDLAARGEIAGSDRATIAALGGPALARQRVASVSSLLLHYGIVPVEEPVGGAAPNHAIIAVGRTLVTLPPCPNWSKRSGTDFGNQPSSNFGCATETNLGMMIANPSDSRRRLAGRADAGPAARRGRKPLPQRQGRTADRQYRPAGGDAVLEPTGQWQQQREHGHRPGLRQRESIRMAAAVERSAGAARKPDRVGVVAIVHDQVTLDRIQGVIRELQLDDELSFEATLDAALRRIHEGANPRVLVVDLSESPAPISELSSARAVGGDELKILALGTVNDVGLYRDMIAAGATDYLVKPPGR